MTSLQPAAFAVFVLIGASVPAYAGDPQVQPRPAQTGPSCDCGTSSAGPKSGPGDPPAPPKTGVIPPPKKGVTPKKGQPAVAPPAACADARNCDKKAADEALLLEAEANRRAARWTEAAKSFLEVVKHATDAKTKDAAVAGYRDTIDRALSAPKADEARRLAAETEKRAGHWNTAADKYLDAVRQASDANIQQRAQQEYLRATDVTTSRWWRWGTYAPPIWWAHVHPYVFLVLFAAVVWMALSPLWIRGGVIGPLLQWLPGILRPRFSGRARILATTTLTSDAPAALFAAQLPHSALEVRRRWERVGVSFLSGTTTLLSVPTALADRIATNIPEIKGINVGKLATLLLLLGQYFTWRVESQVGFSPDSAADKSPGRMRAYATLRWAWFTEGSYAVSPRANHAADFEKAAYAIAARVLGAAAQSSRLA